MKSQAVKPTYIPSDHHADYDDLIRVLFRRGLRNYCMIHVGDGEEGYPDSWDAEIPEHLDNAFASLDSEYLSIRGNHCYPHVFDGSVSLPNFKLLRDYTASKSTGRSGCSSAVRSVSIASTANLAKLCGLRRNCTSGTAMPVGNPRHATPTFIVGGENAGENAVLDPGVTMANTPSQLPTRSLYLNRNLPPCTPT